MNFLKTVFPFYKPFFSFAEETATIDPAISAPATPPVTTAPSPTPPASEPSPVSKPDVSAKSSDEIKDLLSKPSPEKPAGTPEVTKPADEVQNKDDWFDKERGFKTKEDAIKSYQSLQETLRQRAEREKQLQTEIDSLKNKSVSTPLTPEEKTKQEALEKWKTENKQALDFLKEEIKKDMHGENLVKDIQSKVLDARNTWKQEFDKDDARKQLWPKMEEIWAKHGNLETVQAEVFKNPFPFIEALAFYQSFPTIAEKIKSEAVEQYKANIRQAAEAERAGKTALPGGQKQTAPDVDPAKMSSTELAALLPRAED